MEQFVRVSDHALQRYRERFGPTSMTEEVVSLFRRATPAPAWIRKQITSVNPDRTAVVADETVMIVCERSIDGHPVVHVISVMPVNWWEWGRIPKSERKRKTIAALTRRRRV